jgi:hypothetical protein
MRIFLKSRWFKMEKIETINFCSRCNSRDISQTLKRGIFKKSLVYECKNCGYKNKNMPSFVIEAAHVKKFKFPKVIAKSEVLKRARERRIKDFFDNYSNSTNYLRMLLLAFIGLGFLILSKDKIIVIFGAFLMLFAIASITIKWINSLSQEAV